MKSINLRYEAANLETAFEEYMEAQRTKLVEMNSEALVVDMRILENIVTNRQNLELVMQDKTLRWLSLSGDDEKDMKRITSMLVTKAGTDSSSTCLLQSAMIQMERECVTEIYRAAVNFLGWKEVEAKREAK